MLEYSGGGYLVKNSKCDDDIGYFMFMKLYIIYIFYYIFVNIFTFFKSSKTI